MSSLTLLLMRHAKSDWGQPGLADYERPLNPRGERDAPRLGRWLRENGLEPAAALVSTARRARQTAEAVLEAAGAEGAPSRTTRRLYGAGPEEIFRAVREAAADGELPGAASPLLVVAHNPGMEELAARCERNAAPAGGIARPFPTGAVAVVACPGAAWNEIPAPEETEAVRVVRPRELKSGRGASGE